jgi:exo-poly-alpha-galacturonosidase
MFLLRGIAGARREKKCAMECIKSGQNELSAVRYWGTMNRFRVWLVLGGAALLGCGGEDANAPRPPSLTEPTRMDEQLTPSGTATPSGGSTGSGDPTRSGEGAPITALAPSGDRIPGGDSTPTGELVPSCASPSAGDPAIIPLQLEVPTLAWDETSIVLVWHKPNDYAEVVDYRVYDNCQLLGSADSNNNQFSPAKAHIDGFYAADAAQFHVKASIHNFTVDGLEPDSSHSFTVRSVLRDGTESADSNLVVQRTLPQRVVVDVRAAPYGAVGNGTTLNTAALQAAIDACPADGKVLVTGGTFKTGALFLKSNMTFEIAEGATLLGSENSADYPLARGYELYDYITERRPPSLLNAIDQNSKSAGTFENIRIVGKGTIDGNGWLRTAAGSLRDEVGALLPQYRAGNGNSVPTDGVLAGDQVARAVAGGLAIDAAYSNRRSSLITLRGVRSAYYAGLTLLNPAFHGIMNLETENVVLNGVVIETYDVNNGDGVEFGNSTGALVFNTFFDTGDDCVNFAAGMGAESSAQPPQQNVWIFNNYFREGHGAVAAGSHTGAWIQHVLAEDNVMFHTDVGLRMKSNVQIGGGGRDFVFRDSAMKDASNQAFIFTLAYGANNNVYASAPTPAQFRDVVVSNISVDGATTSIRVDGFDPNTAAQNTEGYSAVFQENIVFQNVVLNAAGPTQIDHLRDSSFENVVFTNVVGGAAPWVVSNSPGVEFLGATTAP